MNELEEQKKELRVALAAAKLKEYLGLKKGHIVFSCISLREWTTRTLTVKSG